MIRMMQAHSHTQKPPAFGHDNNSSGTEKTPMPIAVIGMSCRLAGTATSPEGLWQMLSKGQSAWSRGDNSRFKMEAFYHPAKEMRGAVC